LCNEFCKLELSVSIASLNDSLTNSDKKNSIPYCFKLKCNILYIYIYIYMMFKTVLFNLHESNFQSLMMHADDVTVVGFRVTFGDNRCQTICFYSYENCVHVSSVISEVNVYILF